MRIIFVGRTNSSIEMDDRIKKESKTLKELGHDVEILFLDRDNKKLKGKTVYGIDVTLISLFFRKISTRGKLKFLKAFEMHLRFILILLVKKWEVLWVHDHKSAGLIYFGWISKFFGKKLVWDQHELGPDYLLNNKFYHMTLNLCDIIIQANEERADHIKSLVGPKIGRKLHVIENFPVKQSENDNENQIDKELNKWLNGSDYLIFQGVAHENRKIMECVEAIMQIQDLKLVVMGPIEDETLKKIKDKWDNYDEKIFITGWIKPNAFRSFSANAKGSLIFYENIDKNHWLCAPNRFFYALNNFIPIVCGINPPMKRIVKDYKVGIVDESNGTSSHEIKNSIKTLLNNKDKYKRNMNKCYEKFTWDSQFDVFEKITHVLK